MRETKHGVASMEPGHEDREYNRLTTRPRLPGLASMEPGHEDREYAYFSDTETYAGCSPQWSPVMKTGNTRESFGGGLHPQRPQWSPVMKTGNTSTNDMADVRRLRLNGARS